MRKAISKYCRHKVLDLILPAIALFLMIGCGTMEARLKVNLPPEINMSPYKQVVVSEIGGNMGREVSNTIRDEISGRLQLVGQNRLDEILRELKMSHSDLTDAKSRSKLGKKLNAAAMIAGNVNGEYSGKLRFFDRPCDGGQLPLPCKEFQWTGTYRITGSIDIIDLQTGEIIKSRPIGEACSNTSTGTDVFAEAVNKKELMSSCADRIARKFIKAITSRKRTVKVSFLIDKAIPELEDGVRWAKMGDTKEAINIFAKGAKKAEGDPKIKPKVISKAYFDMGLIYKYTDEFDKAIEAFKKAYSLYPDDMYIKEKVNTERPKAEKKGPAEKGE
ncbi:MAG: tetratricopeptide repeat protein [Nitrospirae bacterium]|nr:tetratricopeptide repeat protein [Nitrospirota bacterium]